MERTQYSSKTVNELHLRATQTYKIYKWNVANRLAADFELMSLRNVLNLFQKFFYNPLMRFVSYMRRSAKIWILN